MTTLTQPIEQLDLPVGSYLSLKRSGIGTIGELIKHTEDSLRKQLTVNTSRDERNFDAIVGALRSKADLELKPTGKTVIEILLDRWLPTSIYSSLKGPLLGVHTFADLEKKTEEELRAGGLSLADMAHLREVLNTLNEVHGTDFGPKPPKPAPPGFREIAALGYTDR